MVTGKDRVTSQSRFLELFPLRLNSSIKVAESATWRALSQFHYLTDQEILDVLNTDSKKMRAFSFDDRTRFAVLVLPSGSVYLNPAEFSKLTQLFSQLGVSVCAYKTGSEDIHLYIYFTNTVATKGVSATLTSLLTHAGFSINPEALIVYPNDDCLPFPLQKGFAWLDNRLEVTVKREDLSFDQALELFLADLDNYGCDFDLLITQPDQTANIDTARQSALIDQVTQDTLQSVLIHLEPILPEGLSRADAKHADLTDYPVQSRDTEKPTAVQPVEERSSPPDSDFDRLHKQFEQMGNLHSHPNQTATSRADPIDD